LNQELRYLKWLARLGVVITAAIAGCSAQTADIGHDIVRRLQAGNYAEARRLADEALRSSPRDARLWTLKGLALVPSGDQSGALSSFLRALELSPEYLPALEGAAHIEYETDPARALPFLRRIVRIRPNDQATHAMLAEIASHAGHCETAAREAALSQPDAAEAAQLKQSALCLAGRKQWDQASVALKKLTTMQPAPANFYYLATAEFLAGQFAEVVRTVAPFTAAGTATPNMLELLAEAYDFSSDSNRALDTLKRAIAADPNVPEYYSDFAYMCQAHRCFQKGIEVVSNGLEKLPRAASLYVARGLLYSELAEWNKAEADFQKASELDPNVELGSAAHGLAELQQNDLTNAEKIARMRLQAHPEDAFSQYLLAEVLAKKGAAPGTADFAEALKAANTAVRLKPDLLVGHNLLARLYLQNGENREAAEHSRIVYRANPMDQTALYHLIIALRKEGGSPEIPGLLKQLAQLKERSRKADDIDRESQTITPHSGFQQQP
jgi:tetratricopeptide (TPR) repeat protein